MPLAAPEVQSGFLSLPGRVLSTAARLGDLPAIRGATCFTYGELGQEIHAVAATLLDRLGEGNDVVVLLFAQDAPLVAALLGTLAAGKVYVVADPAHPPAALAAIVRDSTASLLLADPIHLPLAAEIAGGVPVVDVSGLPRSARTGSLPALDPDLPAALYYTSGSTGAPKGVLKSQDQMVDSSAPMVAFLGDQDRYGLTASLGFSNSMGAFLAPLVCGGSVSMLDGTPRSAEQLTDWLEDEGITVFRTTPSTFRAVARARGDRPFESFRLVVLGAEASYGRDMELFRRTTGPGATLRLSWGSTEAGGVTQRLLTRNDEVEPGILHSGWPTHGTVVTILDGGGQAVSAGTPGRIAINSRRIALRYWRRPDLDAEFAVDPVDPRRRTFLTRDLGRLRPDGALEWRGRLDHQVKVRGVSVDTAAVEAALMSLEGVRESAVVARDGPDGTRLVGYVGGETASGQELRRQLAGAIPFQMVPASIVTLGSLPRNANGKVDRGALPTPPQPRHDPDAEEVPEDLLSLWRMVLGRPDARPGDDFFDSGGDSLVAVSLLSGIATRFGIDLPPTVLWEAPTLQELAAVVTSGGAGIARTLVVVREGREAPLFYVPSGNKAFRAEHTDLVGLRALAELLGPEPPVLAFHYDPRDLTPGTVVQVDDAARRFVAAMRKRQPEGPYRLCGYSIGGKVAWEMAQQLLAADQEVSLLVLLDTPGPGFPRTPTWREPLYWRSFARRARHVVARAPGLGVAAGLREIRRAATAFLRRGLGSDPPPPAPIQWGQYRWRPFPGRVLLMRAEERNPISHQDWSDPTNGLGPYAAHLEVLPIPGGHADALRPGRVEGIARALAERLGT